jgi:O-antigen/teichoic acid export membrane protein
VRLGDFQFVMLLTNVTAGITSSGLAITTRKYMAEYLNRGEGGAARAIYHYALRTQIFLGAGVTVVGAALVMLAGEPPERCMSLLLVSAMAPRILGAIPSQANVAGEMMQRNTWPSLLGGAITVAFTWFSLWVGWDLPGIAAGFALGAAVDVAIKLRLVHSWLAPMPRATIPPELKKRMYSFSGQALVLMVLNIVVWDRSDMVVLKWTNPGDLGKMQITFFSIAFSLTDRILMAPMAFSGSLGATMMAQVGRARERVMEVAVTGAKYTFLLALPLLAGMAAVSQPFVLAAYKNPYQPMIPVLVVSTLLAVPKALSISPTILLQSMERQGFLIWTGCICGAIDIGLDFLLTPTHGAVGAALANGLAQTLAALMIWFKVYRDYKVNLRLGEFARIALSGGAMLGAVLAVERLLPFSHYAVLACSIAAGGLVWFVALRLTGALNHSDAERLLQLGSRVPGAARPAFERCIRFLQAADQPREQGLHP